MRWRAISVPLKLLRPERILHASCLSIHTHHHRRPYALRPHPPSRQAPPAESLRSIAGGGICVPGWTGKADNNANVNDAKLTKEGNALHVVTGPAITYWNPAQKATGEYTVSATFTEPKYMNLNSHPHPYGIMIARNDLGTDNQSYLYCAAYGNGILHRPWLRPRSLPNERSRRRP